MFENSRAFSGFAVDDIEAAKRFYGQTFGLRVFEANGLLTLHLAGERDTMVYPKPDHTPASYTIPTSRLRTSTPLSMSSSAAA
jgi:catechol 2,3-dioxygenase-like lactoylglutathione lyase family enzyme